MELLNYLHLYILTLAYILTLTFCNEQYPCVHPFIVASFNAQSVNGNNMACKRCEISTFIKDNGVELFFCD